MNILLAGGAGYIGSHTCVELLENGQNVIIADNLSNSNVIVLQRIRQITGKNVPFYNVDIRDQTEFNKVFLENDIDCIIHFAGLKAVGESVEQPINYYDNNLNTTLSICNAMERHNVRHLIFSSSATVYSAQNNMPLDESSKTGNCTNPYGWTKLFCEQILCDFARKHNDFSVILLRYFNPVGAHESGLIGEDPSGIPNNLLPFITKTAIGSLKELAVFGNDYCTHDGTGIRDYIHVVDLAKGHVAAIDFGKTHNGVEIFNLSTGKGTSVLDMVNAFQRVNCIHVPYRIDQRRAGDIAQCYANPEKAEKILKWKAKYNIEDIVKHAWNWQKNNPNGYKIKIDEL